MRYFKTETYGNVLNLKGTGLTKRDREQALDRDKNEFVQIVCKLRVFKWQTKRFDEYVKNAEKSDECIWRINLTATPLMHRAIKAFFNRPEPLLKRWNKDLTKYYSKLYKRQEKQRQKAQKAEAKKAVKKGVNA